MAKNLLYLLGILIVAWLVYPYDYGLLNRGASITTTLLCVYCASQSLEKLSRMWVAGWAINTGVWWYMVANGTMRRLRADDDITDACGRWMLMALVQHIFHFDALHRAVALLLGLTIILSSTHWWKQLLTALVLGDVGGYIIERMLRDTFLRRVEVREMLREAQAHVANVEHIRREQLIAQQRGARFQPLREPQRRARRSTSPSPRRTARSRVPGQLEPIASENDTDSSGRSSRSNSRSRSASRSS